MTPAEILRKFFITVCRAEGTGVVASDDVKGSYPDIRKEQDIPKHREDNDVFNLGVAAGIKALLSQLSEEGYVIRDASGNHVNNAVHDLGERYQIWLSMPDQPSLRVVGKPGPGYVPSGGK